MSTILKIAITLAAIGGIGSLIAMITISVLDADSNNALVKWAYFAPFGLVTLAATIAACVGIFAIWQ